MNRIVVALKWACGAATFAFVVMFLTPLAIGGPEAHQAPLVAFVLTPIVFVVTLVLALVWSRLGLLAIMASLLYPPWYYAHMPPREAQGTLVPLSAEERALVRSRHFDARVAVDKGKAPPIYQTQLIDDLGRTGLFTAVGAMEDTRSADLIATVTGSYYGDKTGHSFSLRWSRQPERTVKVKVWFYASDGPLLYASRHRLHVERLALEVVRQMDALGSPGQTRSTSQVALHASVPGAAVSRAKGDLNAALREADSPAQGLPNRSIKARDSLANYLVGFYLGVDKRAAASDAARAVSSTDGRNLYLALAALAEGNFETLRDYLRQVRVAPPAGTQVANLAEQTQGAGTLLAVADPDFQLLVQLRNFGQRPHRTGPGDLW